MSDEEKPYKVGYGKPPKETRFKSGESGNKKGRPKSSKNFSTLLTQELHSRVDITENGKRCKISKMQAGAKQFANKVASGDPKFVSMLFSQSRAETESHGTNSHEATFSTTEDELVMQNILVRLKQRLSEVEE